MQCVHMEAFKVKQRSRAFPRITSSNMGLPVAISLVFPNRYDGWLDGSRSTPDMMSRTVLLRDWCGQVTYI